MGLIHAIGAIAQSVEQRIENPCVPSSILGHATIDLYFQSLIPSGIFFTQNILREKWAIKSKAQDNC